MRASASLLWLGAAVSLSAFVAAYLVALFVADQLAECTTPAVLPITYFIMLGYAVMAAQFGINDMLSSGDAPPYIDELQWASFIVLGLAIVWVGYEYSIWLIIGFLIVFFVPLGAVYLVVGLPVFAMVLRLYQRTVPDLDASTVWPATFLALAPFAVFPLHDIDARCGVLQ
jgi:hypothetical protein